MPVLRARPKAHASALFLILVALLVVTGQAAWAQTEEPERPVYIVQQGDSLWDIAQRFDVNVNTLMSENQILEAGLLAPGDRLRIPGLTGFSGSLTTRPLGLGETLRSVSRQSTAPSETLARLNGLTSPAEWFVGAQVIVPIAEDGRAPARAGLRAGESLLELALRHGANPWRVAQQNRLPGPLHALPGDVLLFPGQIVDGGPAVTPSGLPDAVTQATISPLPLVQGQAAVLQVSGQPGLTLSGTLAGRELHFFSSQPGRYLALQGVHAMQQPGFYPLDLLVELPDGSRFPFRQPVAVSSGSYAFDPVLTVSPATLDPAITRPEDAQWIALATPVTREQFWQGPFRIPVPEIYHDCWPSMFGNRRAYNASNYLYFHTGQDYCGGVGTEVYAPAAGRVVFAGPLTVRGNAIMLDHGWGVYSDYMHLSEVNVAQGERVEAGQLIGLVGGTGRVTGPHLHYEIWAGGVQVDPLDWLARNLPVIREP